MPAKSPKRRRHTRYNGGIIRKRGDSYQAEFSRHGTVERKQFPNAELCRSWIDSHALEHEQRTAPPSMADIIELREARALLPDGVSVVAAARAYAALHSAPDPSRTAGAARSAFLREKEGAGLRASSLKMLDLQTRVIPKNVPLLAVTPDDVQDWLDATGASGWTRDGYRRALHNFFAWCLKRDYIHRNPVSALTSYRADSNGSTKHVLTPTQTGKLITTCASTQPDLLPYIACKLYAGLRTSEAVALRWEAITPGYIRVTPEVAKTRRQRLIPVRDGLKRLLGLPHNRTGRICPANARNMRNRLITLYNDADLPRRHNDMRDSYITYRYAETQDLSKTAAEAGNTSTVTMESYRDLATPQAARAYFSAWKKVNK